MQAHKTHFTTTFRYYDFDRTRRAAIARYTAVILWDAGHGSIPEPGINPEAGLIVSAGNPTQHWANVAQGSTQQWALVRPIIGVTLQFALDGKEVMVALDGITPLIVNAQVNAGDLLFAALAGGVTQPENRLLVRSSSQTPFSRIPELRPIIHPEFGRDYNFLITPVRALANNDPAFNRANHNQQQRFFPIGIALRSTTADAGTNPQVIPVRLLTGTVFVQ
jgi:hypothetical protein